jgi:hypothetical protein
VYRSAEDRAAKTARQPRSRTPPPASSGIGVDDTDGSIRTDASPRIFPPTTFTAVAHLPGNHVVITVRGSGKWR